MTIINFQDVLTRTYKAAGTILAGQPVGGDLQLAEADDHIIGIAMHDVESGDIDSVMVLGTCEVVANGAINPGDYIKVGADGKFLAADAAALAAGKVVGKNLELTAMTDGDKIQAVFFGI